MRDIENRKDIELLIDKFYEQIISDELIGSFFTETVALDWKVHIPIMYDFWETILLDKVSYKGNAMIKHIELSRKKRIKPEHFDRWLNTWKKTIHNNFQGPKSEEAINRANSIAGIMKMKLDK